MDDDNDDDSKNNNNNRPRYVQYHLAVPQLKFRSSHLSSWFDAEALTAMLRRLPMLW
jgi:hypothetical protein